MSTLSSLNSVVWSAVWAIPLAFSIWAALAIRNERRAAATSRRRNEYHRAIIERVGEGILVADATSGKLIEANPVLLRKLGYQSHETSSLNVSDILIDTAGPAPLGRQYRPTTLARTTREIMQRARDGSLVSVDVSVTALECDGRPALCYVIRETTPRRAREKGLVQGRSEAGQRANYLAHRDPATGLANRQSFKSDLRKALANGRHDDIMAVLLIGLRDFSSLNDTFGPNAGDAVLAEVAARLRRMIDSSGSLLARVGNDEFAIALQPVADVDSVASIALNLQSALSVPMRCLEYEIDVSANVGICLCRVGGAVVDALLSDADLALSAAKSTGRGSMQFFSDEMDEKVRRRLNILLSLRDALEHDQLTMHYQPVIDIDTRAMVGFEALARWQHPRLGLVPPGEFIAAAEQGDLIVPLGERVLRLVCEQIVRWRQNGLSVVPIAVNFSARQFQRQSVVRLVQKVLAETGVAGSDLVIEITESSLMSAADRHAPDLQALRAIGVRIMVDDFGTGYSSLSYLKHLPLDALKIDGSFIANVHSSPTDEAIVRAILAMARSLGLKVVAEGVESASQLEVLEQHGCPMAQGFYFGRPMPAEQCSTLLREREHSPPVTDTLRLCVCTPANVVGPKAVVLGGEPLRQRVNLDAPATASRT